MLSRRGDRIPYQRYVVLGTPRIGPRRASRTYSIRFPVLPPRKGIMLSQLCPFVDSNSPGISGDFLADSLRIRDFPRADISPLRRSIPNTTAPLSWYFTDMKRPKTTKSEYLILNPSLRTPVGAKQIQNPKLKCSKHFRQDSLELRLGNLDFGHSILFRISCFGPACR